MKLGVAQCRWTGLFVVLLLVFAVSATSAVGDETDAASVIAADNAAEVVATGPTRARFGDDPDDTPFHTHNTSRRPGPAVVDGSMTLAQGFENMSGSVAFDRTASGMHRKITASFGVRFPAEPGGLGGGFALLPTSSHGESGPFRTPEGFDWSEPNLPGTLAVGFDIHNPPGGGPFNHLGNIYNRPQREISLHWDGVEVANRLSPVEFRTGDFMRVLVEVEYVTGGAVVSVGVAEEAVYDRYFVAFANPYESRAAFGATCGDVVTAMAIDDVRVEFTEPIDGPMSEPVVVRVFDGQLVTGSNQRPRAPADFSGVPADVGRIVATLTLSEPEMGFDPWDKLGAIYLWSPSGGATIPAARSLGGELERFEVLRFITPFGRGWTWHADVTHLAPLFQGERDMGIWIDTWQNGWLLTLDLSFFPAGSDLHPDRARPRRVVNLWNGAPEIGNPEKPVSEFYVPRRVRPPLWASRAMVYTTVTGHGMLPNSNNAGEFMPIERTIRAVGGQAPTDGSTTFRDTLWKMDVYLNPCRPQGGTWKYDRAGWAPGSIVDPWVVDFTPVVVGREEVTFGYELAPYVNEGRGKTWAPFHQTESVVVFYGPLAQ